MSVATLNNISFGYNGLPLIFEGVSFAIDSGEFIGLIGSNGSGKTTLVKVMLGLLKPNTGTVNLFGEDQNAFGNNKQNWSKIGYIPQTASQPKDFPITVEELLGISILGVSTKKSMWNGFGNFENNESKNKTQQVLQKLDINNLKNKEISQLSGGERQKVYLARALINSPKLIILDEPTTGIDQLSEKDFYNLIDGIRRDLGTTIIMISHDISSISDKVDRIFCLDKTLEIIDNPREYPHNQHIHILSHNHVH
jgi:zinc transport system ATP-binding protein